MSEPKTYTGQAENSEVSVNRSNTLDELVKKAMDEALVQAGLDDDLPVVSKRIMASARAPQKQFAGTLVVRLAMGSGEQEVKLRTKQPENVRSKITVNEPLNPGNVVAQDLLTKARGQGEAMRKKILDQQEADLKKLQDKGQQPKDAKVPDKQPVRVIVILTPNN